MELRINGVWFSVVVVLLGALFCGCGGPDVELGDVTGVVKLDGEPLSNARVLFQPDAGRPSEAVTDSAGRYQLQFTADYSGAVTGMHTVHITTRETTVGEDYKVVETPERVPAKYNRESELRVEVEGGPNEFNFDLKTSG